MTDAPLVYRGHKHDLPAFLLGFAVPVPRAWFDVLFKERKEKKQAFYICEAYAIEIGYIIYDCQEAYTAELWDEAMKTIGFAVQVDWAQSTGVTTNAKGALLEVTILRPDEHRHALKKDRTLTTTQGQFVAFLRSGELTDLETKGSKE